MTVLVTGAKGFIGKNLCIRLRQAGYTVLEYDINNNDCNLDEYAKWCDFVIHLAGVNRSPNPQDFMEGNFGFTSKLLDTLKKHDNNAPIIVSSSIQAELDNPYGQSKKAGEDLLIDYARQNNVNVIIYRLPNVFGKWCRPNYNSVVATFCHNIARGLDIRIDDPDKEITLCYIDDVCDEFIDCIKSEKKPQNYFGDITKKYHITVGQLAQKIYEFKNSRANLNSPDMSDQFTKKLYSTYLSYLPEDKFSYQLTSRADNRGSFTEFMKAQSFGQVSVNVIKPGIVKGNHWHHTKNEKFLVVKGSGVIRFRSVIEGAETISYLVDGDHLEVVDIPPGYTHNIENLGDEDMVVIIWANEPFDPDRPDTYFEEV